MGNHSNEPREPRYDVVWPLSRRAPVAGGAADRLPDLNGKTICELWDMNFRGEVKGRFPV